MSDESNDNRPTQMMEDRETRRVAESTARTADYTDGDALPDQERPGGDTVQHHVVRVSEDEPLNAVGNATVFDVSTAAKTSSDITMADAEPLATNASGAGGGANVTHPDVHDDREALDRKIRAHLDQDAPKKDKRDPLIGTVVGGRFEIVSKLGAGGMGAVYKAQQRGIDRAVAIKVLLQELTTNETLIRRFTIEALAVSRLKHPNTIQIFDFGKTDQGNLYIAMELLEGETLYARHARERRLPIRKALRIVGQVAASLAEAHDKGIIHRDLKPENIFLTLVGVDPDFVKVLDFGVAKLRDGAGDGKGTLTQAGSIFGTPRYMSPEQASARPLDARSDVYALGVILYELVVGHAPFLSDTPITLLLAHVNDEPQSPSSACPDTAIPIEVEELILTLLEKSPDDRVQSAGELERICMELAARLPDAFERPVDIGEAAELGVALSAPATVHVPMAGLPSDTRQTEGPPTSQDRPRKRSTLALVVAIAVAAAGLTGTAVWWKSQADKRAAAAARELPGEDQAGEGGAGALVAAADVSDSDAGSGNVRIHVKSQPAGATVVRIGPPDQLLGKTPLALVQPSGTRFHVRLTYDKHQDQKMELLFDESSTLRIVLPHDVTPTVVHLPAKQPAAKPRVGRRVNRRRAATKKPPATAIAHPKKVKVTNPPKAVKPKPAKPKPDPGLVDDLM